MCHGIVKCVVPSLQWDFQKRVTSALNLGVTSAFMNTLLDCQVRGALCITSLPKVRKSEESIVLGATSVFNCS
jgi:hypothetical protein